MGAVIRNIWCWSFHFVLFAAMFRGVYYLIYRINNFKGSLCRLLCRPIAFSVAVTLLLFRFVLSFS